MASSSGGQAGGEMSNAQLPAISQLIDPLILGYLSRCGYMSTVQTLLSESAHLQSSMTRLSTAAGSTLLSLGDTLHEKNLEQIIEQYRSMGRFETPVEFLELGVRLRQLANDYSSLTSLGPTSYSLHQQKLYGRKVSRPLQSSFATPTFQQKHAQFSANSFTHNSNSNFSNNNYGQDMQTQPFTQQFSSRATQQELSGPTIQQDNSQWAEASQQHRQQHQHGQFESQNYVPMDVNEAQPQTAGSSNDNGSQRRKQSQVSSQLVKDVVQPLLAVASRSMQQAAQGEADGTAGHKETALESGSIIDDQLVDQIGSTLLPHYFNSTSFDDFMDGLNLDNQEQLSSLGDLALPTQPPTAVSPPPPEQRPASVHGDNQFDMNLDVQSSVAVSPLPSQQVELNAVISHSQSIPASFSSSQSVTRSSLPSIVTMPIRPLVAPSKDKMMAAHLTVETEDKSGQAAAGFRIPKKNSSTGHQEKGRNGEGSKISPREKSGREIVTTKTRCKPDSYPTMEDMFEDEGGYRPTEEREKSRGGGKSGKSRDRERDKDTREGQKKTGEQRRRERTPSRNRGRRRGSDDNGDSNGAHRRGENRRTEERDRDDKRRSADDDKRRLSKQNENKGGEHIVQRETEEKRRKEDEERAKEEIRKKAIDKQMKDKEKIEKKKAAEASLMKKFTAVHSVRKAENSISSVNQPMDKVAALIDSINMPIEVGALEPRPISPVNRPLHMRSLAGNDASKSLKIVLKKPMVSPSTIEKESEEKGDETTSTEAHMSISTVTLTVSQGLQMEGENDNPLYTSKMHSSRVGCVLEKCCPKVAKSMAKKTAKESAVLRTQSQTAVTEVKRPVQVADASKFLFDDDEREAGEMLHTHKSKSEPLTLKNLPSAYTQQLSSHSPANSTESDSSDISASAMAASASTGPAKRKSSSCSSSTEDCPLRSAPSHSLSSKKRKLAAHEIGRLVDRLHGGHEDTSYYSQSPSES